MTLCPMCGTSSEVSWKCSECGKPFDGSEDEEETADTTEASQPW